MRVIKTDEELKREYYSGTDREFIDYIVSKHGGKPATLGEAFWVAKQKFLDLLSQLPVIGKYVK